MAIPTMAILTTGLPGIPTGLRDPRHAALHGTLSLPLPLTLTLALSPPLYPYP